MTDIRERLLQLAAHGNVKFTESLHPGIDHILGLRVPDVRKLAREIAAGDWREYLAHASHEYMEERMLHGMVIGAIKDISLDERLRLVADFIPLINSWSVCDTFCPMLKFTVRHAGEVWRFVDPYFQSDDEYAVRFAVVMAMGYYINETYLPRLFDRFDAVTHEGYYVKMAVAWAVSVCYVKFPSETEEYLQHSRLDAFTQNKAVQKIRESYRVERADKERVLQYRR